MSVIDNPVVTHNILEEWGPQLLRLASHRTVAYTAVKLYLPVLERGRPKKFHGQEERWR